MTLLPKDEVLRAEVWVGNQDVGFVDSKPFVKLKIAAFAFQKYGMVEGTVLQVSATEAPTPNTRTSALSGREQPSGALAFRTLVI